MFRNAGVFAILKIVLSLMFVTAIEPTVPLVIELVGSSAPLSVMPSCIAHLGGGQYYLGSGLEPVGSVASLNFSAGDGSAWTEDRRISVDSGLRAAGCAAGACRASSQAAPNRSDSSCVWMGTNSYTGGDFEADSPFASSSMGYHDNRLALVSMTDGSISLEAEFGDGGTDNIPTAIRYRRAPYSWDYRQCQGARLQQGFDGVALSPDGGTLIVAQQTALFQDGPVPSYTQSSPARLLLYAVTADRQGKAVLALNRTVVYNVSQVIERPAAAFGSSSSGIKAVLWLEGGDLLVLENSFTAASAAGLSSSSSIQGSSLSRMFLVRDFDLAAATDVTACNSLAAETCQYAAVPKRLVATLQEAVVAGAPPGLGTRLASPHSYFLGGATWGPDFPDGRKLLVTANDAAAGSASAVPLLLAFAVDPQSFTDAPVFAEPDMTSESQRQLYALIIGGCATAVLLVLTWVLFWTFLNPIKPGRGPQVDPSTADFWFKHRSAVMWVAHLRNFLVSGAVYGYPALELTLRSLGVYSSSCICGSFCAAQQEAFAIISLSGFVANIGGRILWGYMLDVAGPRVVTDLGMLICAAGIGLLLAGAAAPGCLVVGWAFLGLGGASIHMANFHLQHLFPSNRKAISATFSMTFAASSIVFTLWQALYEYASVPWEVCLGIYLGMAVAAGLASHFLQPADMFTQPRDAAFYSSMSAEVEVAVSDSEVSLTSSHVPTESAEWTEKARIGLGTSPAGVGEWVATGDGTLPTRTTSTLALARSVSRADHGAEWHREARRHLRTAKYWTETLWYSLGILQFQWYVSTVGSQLYQLGDEGSGPVTSMGNFKYLKAANVYNSLAALWWPVSVFLMQGRRSFKPIIGLHQLVSLVFSLTLCIPMLEVQTVTFTFQSMSRFLLFSAHHAYLSNEFPMNFFGVLNAVTYTVSAAMTLLIYPMQNFTVNVLNSNYTPFNITFAAFNLAGIVALFTPWPWSHPPDDSKDAGVRNSTTADKLSFHRDATT